MVQSVLGTASLDGAWTFGCSDPDVEEGGINFEKEFLVYQGNSVESRVYLYAPNDTTCTDPAVGVDSEGPFEIMVKNDPEDLVLIEAWLGEDENENEVLLDPPPERQVGGLLPAGNALGEPFYASVEIFKIPGEPDEEGCVYIDDSDQGQNGLNWYLYRCAGEDDQSFIPFLDTNEPLIKSELPVVGVIPVPAGVWLFGTALIGLVGFSKRRKSA